ncbi:tagatose-bisphosphate aldolase [Streptococcus pneumoniae]|nr:tagatose 1,6-diphosphate aldolase [Streptococcus pneumoniae GA56348]EJH21332.1 tagatose 1,6-diphosphate aldolase [Streptococcus pneumoniae GA58981]KYQ25994.1 tagatose-bisphosphate aldolase [Streptococcus pneumoniae]EJH21622.1 tagatose 1,6-diphosphate aldolase [Streptococcus pneumoniae GA58981]EJH22057.1 tagatose 1,6-diphosphate aldolase [Streptococcus pneumoniae GA58981]
MTSEELKSLGKWYVSTGKEWICHSDDELEEFKNLFLNFINPEGWDTISFDSDFMPFQQS